MCAELEKDLEKDLSSGLPRFLVVLLPPWQTMKSTPFTGMDKSVLKLPKEKARRVCT